MSFLFGKKPFERDSRDLKLANYLDKPALIDRMQAPLLLDWAAVPLPSGAQPKLDRDPLYNNVAGSCVISGAGHKVNLVAQHALLPLQVTADMVRDSYAALTGYNPATGAGDNGAYIREDLLKPWKRDGLWGTKLLAYALVNWRDPEEVALATFLDGGLLGGYSLPGIFDRQRDAQGRFQWTRPEGGWRPGEGPDPRNGHCIYRHGCRSGNTWGEGVVNDQPWDDDSCDELWFCPLDIWRIGDRAPNGFAWQDLVADAEARAAG